MSFTFFSGTSSADNMPLLNMFYRSPTGLSIDYANSQVVYGTYSDFQGNSGTSISLYNGGLGIQNIETGILLSSGSGNPNLYNSSGSFSEILSYSTLPSDADLTAAAIAAFPGAGNITDISSVEFTFTVTDPFIHGIRFDLIFGSDEFPEFSNSSFVDIAGVFLNGENVALFNGDPTQPLSVIDKNLAIGNFYDNTDGSLAIEYDGISDRLTIFAPVQPGVNTLKIAIADTGDQSYDSGLIIANLEGTQLTGSGISGVTYGTVGPDNLVGSSDNETFDAGPGDDQIDPGEGDDIVLAGDGNDSVNGGKGSNQIDGGGGTDTVIYAGLSQLDTQVKVSDNDTILIGENGDTLLNVEIIQFDDISFDATRLLIEDDVAKIYLAYFGRSADPAGLKFWADQVIAALLAGTNYYDALSSQINSFALSPEAESIYPGINDGLLSLEGLEELITSIYDNLFDRLPELAGLDYWKGDAVQLQNQGSPLGSIIKTIIDGALDSPGTLDRTTVQHKAQVAWNYAKQYEIAGEEWDPSLAGESVVVLQGVNSDVSTVTAAYGLINDIFV